MITTLIVEDDFRVADIHSAYVSGVPGFQVIGKAHTCAQAYDMIVEKHPDLILLDLYLPDDHGLNLFSRLQQLPREMRADVFIISAAKDVANVREALQLGAAQYIMKPFTKMQLAERLMTYQSAREKLATREEISQEEIDRLSVLLHGPRSTRSNSEAQRNPTASSILKMMGSGKDPVSANDVSEQLGLSRATAQRYLSQMVENGQLELILRYGATGRPIHLFQIAGK